jgi:transcriptional regulator with XRE-family HTH domain
MQGTDFGKNLLSARMNHGFTQEQLAQSSKLHQSIISAFENGRRLPTVPQLLQLASVLKVSLQWFLTGTNNAGDELRDISVQLQSLGIADLQLTDERVPGTFRRDEEIMALALTGNAPSARIIEAMPAVLAWNAKNRFVLRSFADLYDPRIKHRLGWLADIALTIHRDHGFPGGCPYFSNLEAFVREIELPTQEDPLGFANDVDQRPPVSLRWKMRYPAKLASFRERAERLHSLRADQRFRVLGAL